MFPPDKYKNYYCHMQHKKQKNANKMNYWQILQFKTNKQSKNLVTARWFNILQSC